MAKVTLIETDLLNKVYTTYGADIRNNARPCRKVFFKCPEPQCGFDHAIWAKLGQHLYNHHGYSQESIDMEEVNQRRNRRNKSWLKKRISQVDSQHLSMDTPDDDEEEPSDSGKTAYISALRELLPKRQTEGARVACPATNCGVSVHNYTILNEHVSTDHSHDVSAVGDFKVHNALFENEEDFRDWKRQLEEKHLTYLACTSTCLKEGYGKTFVFSCHRAGKGAKRLLAKQASGSLTKVVKCQRVCTAFMTAHRDLVGRVRVYYSVSHIGHSIDASLLPLNDDNRKYIYARLLQLYDHASVALIAHTIRDEHPDPHSRLHYTTHSDVTEVLKTERKRLELATMTEIDVEIEEDEEEDDPTSPMPKKTRLGDPPRITPKVDMEAFTLLQGRKKGRRRLGEELLSGDRHKPPRKVGGHYDIMELSNDQRKGVKTKPQSMDPEMIELDGVVDYNDMLADGPEDEHAQYYTYEDVVDGGMGEEMEGRGDALHEGVLGDDGRRVEGQDAWTERAVKQCSMTEVIQRKHRVDQHVDNVCEALVRGQDPAALSAFLDVLTKAANQFGVDHGIPAIRR